ncbi:MAG: hypothetical protein ACXV76_08005 [Halobacteriota archaeon]
MAARVGWSHYKHPLLEHVYDTYMRYWGHVRFQHSCEVKANVTHI